jgi:hypothetical protein
VRELDDRKRMSEGLTAMKREKFFSFLGSEGTLGKNHATDPAGPSRVDGPKLLAGRMQPSVQTELAPGHHFLRPIFRRCVQNSERHRKV